MGKIKIKPKLNKDHVSQVRYWNGETYVTKNIAFARNVKDNSIYGRNSSGGSCGWTVRIPSIKKSNRTWRNFYNLFPRIYDVVLKHKNEAVNGIITISSFDFGSLTNKFGCIDGLSKPTHLGKRTIKFKLV